SKRPIADGWQDRRLEQLELEHYFPNGQVRNVGVVNGTLSRDVHDVDLDSPEATTAANYFLPPTGWSFGRPTAPGSHRLYRVTDQTLDRASLAWDDPLRQGKDARLLELRGNGGQTIYPPSVHSETGEPVRWETFDRISEVRLADLIQALRETAAAALL